MVAETFGIPLWMPNDRLFTIGNGSNNANRSNALVMLKNGNTGLGVNNPIAPLHVNSRLVIERLTVGSAGTAALEWRSDGTYRGGMGWDANEGRFFFYDGESNTNTLFINNGRIGIKRDGSIIAFKCRGILPCGLFNFVPQIAVLLLSLHKKYLIYGRDISGTFPFNLLKFN